MSKRFKVRQRNAAKQERQREIFAKFYANVIADIERIKAMPAEERERLRAATEDAP